MHEMTQDEYRFKTLKSLLATQAAEHAERVVDMMAQHQLQIQQLSEQIRTLREENVALKDAITDRDIDAQERADKTP